MFLRGVGRRFASTTSQVNVDAAKNFIHKATAAAEPLIYVGRVGLEFVRQVASHQSLLNPGSFATAQAGISNFFLAFQTGAWKKVTLKQVGELAGKGLQVGGFFIVGEMIGRRNVIGYNVGESSDGHH